jgi:hypothetical protein
VVDPRHDADPVLVERKEAVRPVESMCARLPVHGAVRAVTGSAATASVKCVTSSSKRSREVVDERLDHRGFVLVACERFDGVERFPHGCHNHFRELSRG